MRFTLPWFSFSVLFITFLLAVGCGGDREHSQPGEATEPATGQESAESGSELATADEAEGGTAPPAQESPEPAENAVSGESEKKAGKKGKVAGLWDRFAKRVAGKGDLRPEAAWSPETTGEYPIGAYDNYIETGDLDAIRKRGKLRILVDITNTDSLHRAATPQDIEIERAKRKAEILGLEPVVLYAESFDQLIPMLIEGKGDIIANNMVPTSERRELIDFSIPIASTHDTLVSRTDMPDIKAGESLKGKTLQVTRGTVFEQRARELAKKHPGLKVEVVDTNYVELALEVSMGHIDFTIIDELIFGLVSQFRDNLKKNIVFEREDQLAAGIRKNSPQLKKFINDAIRNIKLTTPDQRFVGDLDQIRERGVLRAVTRNHPGTYFMWKGRVMGYEYEMLQRFAKDLDVRLEIIVAPKHSDLLDYLKEGKADLTASLLTATDARRQSGVDFGPAYMEEKVSVVGRSGETIEDISELEGRTIHVLESSSQYEVLVEILDQYPDIEVELVPEELTIPQILDRVAEGDYDLTIADDITVRLEHHWRDDVDNLIDLRVEDNVYAWAVRESNPQLLETIHQFFNDEEITKLRKTLFHKYFDEPKRTRDEIKGLSEKGEISPFDNIVKRYAKEYDFDWRLVVAQMFQESSFNPGAKSWVGARGLMQVMPDTGKQVGETKLFDPETSVRAGLKYLQWLYRKFEGKGISPENKMWFTLASYNAGLGHVYDAQDLAEEKGWERKEWFNNVEKAMLLLSQEKYYKKARYGYARGREPYDYVRKIAARFRTYAALLEAFERQQQVGALSCTALPLWLTTHLGGLAHIAECREPKGEGVAQVPAQ